MVDGGDLAIHIEVFEKGIGPQSFRIQGESKRRRRIFDGDSLRANIWRAGSYGNDSTRWESQGYPGKSHPSISYLNPHRNYASDMFLLLVSEFLIGITIKLP